MVSVSVEVQPDSDECQDEDEGLYKGTGTPVSS